MIKNYMEILVDEVFNEVKNIYSTCSCEQCISDIKSLALTNLPPVYFLSNVDEGEKKAFLLDRQRKISVLAKLAEAAELVCSKCSKDEKMREIL
ncbi:late competence development ComFB family protein [Tissierella sp. MSJ-40]|uniref:Late competence development ComFB family protein n=1 Tax=Tissierella simiarum TaxID=2841534 RepID=A0ABS6E2A8_9FIRM|nr:late competence development ComFB family protein [Tissierella simiarum]MBU5437039.1 late competence development ComFB family protein [Tissierella simiarum]